MGTTKSQSIQDIEARPQQFVDHRLQGGKLRVMQELVVTAAADSAAHEHIIGLVPSRAVPIAFYAQGAATTAMTGCDCGVYTHDPVAGTVTAVAADIIFDGQDLSGGMVSATPLLGLGTNGRPTASGRMPLWELAGASADPKILYAICMTVAGDVSAPITWTMSFWYTDGA